MDLFSRYGMEGESPPPPPLPSWCTEYDDDDDDDGGGEQQNGIGVAKIVASAVLENSSK